MEPLELLYIEEWNKLKKQCIINGEVTGCLWASTISNNEEKEQNGVWVLLRRWWLGLVYLI